MRNHKKLTAGNPDFRGVGLIHAGIIRHKLYAMIRPIEWSLYPRVHIPYLKNGPIVGVYQINGGVGNLKLIVSAIIRPDARLNIDVIVEKPGFVGNPQLITEFVIGVVVKI